MPQTMCESLSTKASQRILAYFRAPWRWWAPKPLQVTSSRLKRVNSKLIAVDRSETWTYNWHTKTQCLHVGALDLSIPKQCPRALASLMDLWMKRWQLYSSCNSEFTWLVTRILSRKKQIISEKINVGTRFAMYQDVAPSKFKCLVLIQPWILNPKS